MSKNKLRRFADEPTADAIGLLLVKGESIPQVARELNPKIGNRVAIAFLALLPLFALSCSPSPFTLSFPGSEDLGELWIVEDVNCFTCGNGEEFLGRAKGDQTVRLPAEHWYVSLRMPKQASKLMPRLSHRSLARIGEIVLAGSDVSDEDLAYLTHIDLQYIDLSRTQISGTGLQHLRPHKKFIHVDLRSCQNLDPANLSHFKGWKRAAILLANDWMGGNLSPREKQLTNVARKVICDNQPEQVCGTQIR